MRYYYFLSFVFFLPLVYLCVSIFIVVYVYGVGVGHVLNNNYVLNEETPFLNLYFAFPVSSPCTTVTLSLVYCSSLFSLKRLLRASFGSSLDSQSWGLCHLLLFFWFQSQVPFVSSHISCELFPGILRKFGK